MTKTYYLSASGIKVESYGGELLKQTTFYNWSNIYVSDIYHESKQILLMVSGAGRVPVLTITSNDTVSGYEDFVTSFDTICADILSKASNEAISLSNNLLEDVRGLSFLYIADTSAHTADIYGFEVIEDAVISAITSGETNLVSTLGISGVTLTSSDGFFPLGKYAASSIQLTSGKIKAIIR